MIKKKRQTKFGDRIDPHENLKLKSFSLTMWMEPFCNICSQLLERHIANIFTTLFIINEL